MLYNPGAWVNNKAKVMQIWHQLKLHWRLIKFFMDQSRKILLKHQRPVVDIPRETVQEIEILPDGTKRIVPRLFTSRDANCRYDWEKLVPYGGSSDLPESSAKHREDVGLER